MGVKIMDGEMSQSEVGAPIPSEVGKYRRPAVVVLVVVIIFVLVIAWLGNWVINQRAGRQTLTEAQKAEILRSLQLPPGTKPLSTVQKNKILNSLKLPPGTTPLTNAQKAEIMKSLY